MNIGSRYHNPWIATVISIGTETRLTDDRVAIR